MEKYLLGIDVGTTGTKTYLFTAGGETVSSSYRGYEMITPDTKTSELRTEDIWTAVVETVREAASKADVKENIAALSLSTQGGTLVPVDKKLNPVCNAIVWNDRNCAPERKKFISETGDEGCLYRTSGWKLGFSLPLLQTRRLKDRRPDVFGKTDLFLSVHDYVSAKMTGIPAVDMSNAGINQFTDINRGKYDRRLLDFAGIRKYQLPVLYRSGEIVGLLTGPAARELGLSPSTVLVAGAHDQYAAAVGAGAVNDGDAIVGTGTSWVVTSVSTAGGVSPGLARSVSACDGMWGNLISLPYGGACLEWMRKKVMSAGKGPELSLSEIDSRCAGLKAAEDGLFFYPFQGVLSGGIGQRCERGQFVNLDFSHSAFNMSLAVMEGIAFQLKLVLEAFPGVSPENGIRLTGGASKSRLWTQIIADVLGVPVINPSVPDVACVGAAIIAGAGCGVFGSVREGCFRLLQSEKKTFPDTSKAEMYKSAFRAYRENAGLIGKFSKQ